MTGPHLLEVKDLTVDFLSLGGAFREIGRAHV